MTATKAKAPKISKETRDAIAFFRGRKSAVELLEDTPIGEFHYRPQTINDAFWDLVSANSAQLGLAIITAAFSAAIYVLIRVGGEL